MREEIVELVGTEDPAIVVKGFDRPNLHLEVRAFHDAAHKRRAVVDYAAAADGPGVVYCATKRATGEVARALRRRGAAWRPRPTTAG